MGFDPGRYGPQVAAILALDGNGERLMPLAEGTCSSAEALTRLRRISAGEWFPEARSPRGALAGLYLYFSCLDECHSVAQALETREGSFWHAIMHRQEPDAGNSAYWFRRAGEHPVFPALRAAAEECGFPAPRVWDPFAFIEFCERARRAPGSPEERAALEVQRAEWQLLFDYCAAPGGER